MEFMHRSRNEGERMYIMTQQASSLSSIYNLLGSFYRLFSRADDTCIK